MRVHKDSISRGQRCRRCCRGRDPVPRGRYSAEEAQAGPCWLWAPSLMPQRQPTPKHRAVRWANSFWRKSSPGAEHPQPRESQGRAKGRHEAPGTRLCRAAGRGWGRLPVGGGGPWRPRAFRGPANDGGATAQDGGHPCKQTGGEPTRVLSTDTASGRLSPRSSHGQTAAAHGPRPGLFPPAPLEPLR